MTKKRFVDYFDKDHNYIIQDLVNEDEYQVGFVNCDEDKFLELVNALAETSCDCITDCEIVMKKLKDENEQLKKENKELRQDNDIKFWKLQYMHYFNSNSLLMSEISRAMRKGYEVSDKFQEYLDELKENNKEIKEKNKRLFGDYKE